MKVFVHKTMKLNNVSYMCDLRRFRQNGNQKKKFSTFRNSQNKQIFTQIKNQFEIRVGTFFYFSLYSFF